MTALAEQSDRYTRRFLRLCLAATGAACFGLMGNALAACAPQQPNASQVARSVAEAGNVRLELTCTPKKLELSGTAVVEITITRPKGLELTPPDAEAMSEVFIVLDFEAKLPGIDGDKLVVRHVYEVEPANAGRLTIPPLKHRFTPSDGEPFEVATKPLDIEVTTMIDADERRTLGDLEAPADPMELPVNPIRYVAWTLAICAAIGLLLAAFALANHRKPPAAPPLTPGEIAASELQELRASGIEKSDAKEFYVQLTGIVRRYVEGTTGVRAPEQTTDEFLREIAQRRLFSSQEQTRFGDFLESADLVKYAAYAPSASDISESLDRAARFVTLQTPNEPLQPATATSSDKRSTRPELRV